MARIWQWGWSAWNIHYSQNHPSPFTTPPHTHTHTRSRAPLFLNAQTQRKLLIALVIAFLFMIVEVAGGIYAHSLAIITDAAHLLSDVSGFAVSALAAVWAARVSHTNFSYGCDRRGGRLFPGRMGEAEALPLPDTAPEPRAWGSAGLGTGNGVHRRRDARAFSRQVPPRGGAGGAGFHPHRLAGHGHLAGGSHPAHHHARARQWQE